MLKTALTVLATVAVICVLLANGSDRTFEPPRADALARITLSDGGDKNCPTTLRRVLVRR